jgi:putative tricarboxylic transport membrane protein
MSVQSAGGSPGAAGAGPVKSPFDLAGGLFLVGVAALGLAGGFNLPFGTLSGIGSGLLPRVVAILIGAFGVLLVLQALLVDGDRLERWHARGPVFVLGAVLMFAMVIRGSTLNFGGILGLPLLASVKVPPLGLLVAGPLAVIVSSFAAKDMRPLETVVFAVGMTLACGVLFKELLGLPIPFDPSGLVPDWLNGAYTGLKRVIASVFAIAGNGFGR